MDTFNVINLDYRKHKYQDIVKNFENTTRVSAVSGKDLSDEYINDVNKNLYIKLKRGEIGCFQSHTNLWKKCIDDNLDYILIAEDDIAPTHNYSMNDAKKSFHKLISDTKDWDICYFSKKYDINNIESMTYKYNLPKMEYNNPIITTNDYKSIKPRCGLHMYAISNQGCKSMLNACKTILAPIDVQMWFTDRPMNAYILMNNLVREKQEYSDTSHYSLYMTVKTYMEDKPKIKELKQRNPLTQNEKKSFRKLINRINNGSTSELSDLMKLYKKYPTFYQINYFISKSYILSNQMETGAEYLKQACSINTECYNTNSEYARLLTIIKKDVVTIALQWLHCHNIDPYKSEPFCNIAEMLIADHMNPPYTLEFIKLGLKNDAKNIQLLNACSRIYERMGDMNNTLQCHLKSLEIEPDNYKIIYNVGLLIAKCENKTDDCVQYLNKCIKINPKFVPAYITLIRYYTIKMKYKEALDICNKGMKINDDLMLLYNHGCISADLMDFDTAEKDYLTVMKHVDVNNNPMIGKLHCQLAIVYRDSKQFELAEKHYDIILTNRYIYFNNEKDADDFLNKYGQYLLLNGKYESGYMYYNATFNKNIEIFHKPVWNDERDCHVVICNMSGLGDIFMFARFIEEVCKRVTKCTFLVSKKIHHIFMSSEYFEQYDNLTIIKETDLNTVCGYNFHADLMQLPEILEIYNPIPVVPYITLNDFPDNGLMSMLNKMMKPNSIKILLNWRGNPENMMESKRGVPIETIENIINSPLLKSKNITWISIQKNTTKYEEEVLKRCGVLHINLDQGDEAFTDTICLMQSIDMVLTSDTSIAHLSATFGIKTIVMLCYLPEWRWGLVSSTSPWYETITCVRQKKWKQWDSIINDVCANI